MLKLDTKHKRKSIILTVLLHALLIFLLFYLSLEHLQKPQEGGIAINFGTTSVGSGKVQPKVPVKSEPKETSFESVKNKVETEKTTATTDKLMTQNIEEAPVIAKKNTKEKETITPAEKNQNIDQQSKQKVEEQKPDKATLAILNSFAKAATKEGKIVKGEGDDTEDGDKGNKKGNPYATSYYSKSGIINAGGIGYGLNGRGSPTHKKVVQKCNEAGTVVVKIVVDRNGNVIQAIPGEKGTTNRASCLLEPAKKTALTFKWNPDAKAPMKQVGFVEVIFGLGE